MQSNDLFDVVTVSGADALAFLQSQFAADLAAMADAQLRWAALLNAQGRVLHVVAAWRLDANRWQLLVPFGRGAELVETLRRYIFRRKVQLAVDADAKVCADAAGVASGVGDLCLSLSREPDALALSHAALDRFIAAGLCLIAPDVSGRQLAHALKLQRFEAFSVKKGCYPGQEIVARTHFLGRNKRELVRLAGIDANTARLGDELRRGGDLVGDVVCVGGTSALAVLSQALPAGSSLTVGQDGPLVTVAEAFADAA